jgi:hypothetical protein
MTLIHLLLQRIAGTEVCGQTKLWVIRRVHKPHVDIGDSSTSIEWLKLKYFLGLEHHTVDGEYGRMNIVFA